MPNFPDVGDPAPQICLPSTDGRFDLYERIQEESALLRDADDLRQVIEEVKPLV